MSEPNKSEYKAMRLVRTLREIYEQSGADKMLDVVKTGCPALSEFEIGRGYQAIQDMPEVDIAFGTKVDLEAWDAWKRKYDDVLNPSGKGDSDE